MEQTLRGFLPKVWVFEVYLEPRRTSLMKLFSEIVDDIQPLSIFANKLYERCSAMF